MHFSDAVSFETAAAELYLAVSSESPLAKIGNDSGTKLEDGEFLVVSRFRFGGKKEAAGGGVAVIEAWDYGD